MKKRLSVALMIFVTGAFLYCQDENGPDSENLPGILVKAAKLLEKIDVSSPLESGEKKLKNRIARHLKKAADSSESEQQKALFRQMASRLKENRLQDINGEFLFVRNTSADLILNFDSKHMKFNPVVVKTNIEHHNTCSLFFQTINSAIGKGLLKRNVRFFPDFMPIKISEVLYPVNFSGNSILLPPYYPEDSIYPRIILVWNNIEKYFNEKLKPISQKIFLSEISDELGPLVLLRHLFLHQIGHFTIPVGMEPGEETGKKKTGLKDLLFPAEEVRADLNYLLLILEMDGKKLIEEGMKEKVFQMFVLQKAERLTAFIDEKTIFPPAVILNAFAAGGGLKVDMKDRKLILDFELLSRIVSSMEPRLEAFLKKGDFLGCKSFLLSNNKIPEQLAVVLGLKEN